LRGSDEIKVPSWQVAVGGDAVVAIFDCRLVAFGDLARIPH